MSAQNSLTGFIAGILQLFEADVMMGTVADVLSMGTVVMALICSTVRPKAVVPDFPVVSRPEDVFVLASVFVRVFFVFTSGMFVTEMFVSGMFVSFMFPSVSVSFVSVSFVSISVSVFMFVIVVVFVFVSVISISIVPVFVISVMLVWGRESCDGDCD